MLLLNYSYSIVYTSAHKKHRSSVRSLFFLRNSFPKFLQKQTAEVMSDWDTVTILKKKAPKNSTMKSEAAVNAARRQGYEVDTQLKWGAGTNKQHGTSKNTAKLDRETEELKHEAISLDVGKLIQQGRQAKGLSQKDLATKINEKPQVITDYESGKGIPNNSIIGKIERVIGLKLRGKDKGQPLQPPGSKK